MNHVYRTIWNHAKGVWQVVGEHTTRQGKTKSSKSAGGAGVLALSAVLVTPGAHAQGIVTDGRTATTVTQNGQVTDIRTSTIQGGNGFNSFSRFNVGSGETANLYVPDSANALINIVRDQRSEINGILNGYKNGQIGGDIYFANPHGMVVGEQGVINVGSLTVTTPDTASLERLLGADGRIDEQAVAQLKAGNLPLSESGLVSVRGQVNAKNGITLSAHDVGIAAGAQLTSGQQALPRIEQLVNIDGLDSGAALTEVNGEIRIVAAHDVNVNGQVVADGAAGQQAGSVEIRAGHDIVIGQGARVSASGQGEHSDGGQVVVKAKQQTTLAQGATVAANAGRSGDGGSVELSADKTVNWAGSLEASAGQGGKAGSVLIDPEEINVAQDQRLGGANYTLQASKKISLADGVMVSTRNIANAQTATQDQHRDAVSIGDSGNITLEAPSIVLGDNAKLYAHTNTSAHQGGDITLKATATEGALITPGVQVGVGSNKTEISLGQGVEVRGRKVNITAESSTALTDSLSEQGLYNAYDADGNPIAQVLTDQQMASQREALLKSGAITPDQAAAGQKGFFEGLIDTLVGNGLLAGVQGLDAQAKVNIGDRVTIVGSGDVNIAAHAATNAKAEVRGLHVGAVVAVTSTDASLNVGQNARIESQAGDVTLKSQSDTTVDTSVKAMKVSSKLPVTVTANVSYADGTADTTVGAGSLIKAAGDASVLAEQNKTYKVAAIAGDSEGAVGIAVLVAISDLDARNHFNGTLEAGHDAKLAATVNTVKNQHSATVLLGDNLGTRVAKLQSDAVNKLVDGMKSFLGKTTEKAGEQNKDENTDGFLKKLGMAGAVAYVNHDNNASLELGSQARVKAGNNAALSAEVTDALNSTVATEISDQKAAAKPFSLDTESTGKENAASVAILISTQNNTAVLNVRPGAELDALKTLSLTSKARLPWLDQSRLSNVIKGFGSDSIGDFVDTVSAGDQLFSTWVNATAAVSGENAQDSGNALSGMVNINDVGLSAKVDVADGVRINQDAAYRGQQQSVDIQARTESQMLNVTADPAVFNTGGAKNGMGAGVIAGNYTHQAEATVGAVDLHANDLKVQAVTDIDLINYAVAGSKNGSNALSGSVSVSGLHNTTRAGIDDGAHLDVTRANGGNGNIDISARDETDALTITGGVVSTTTRAAGVATGVHDIDRTTEAWLGSRDTHLAAGSTRADGDLNVKAEADGRIGNYALSVALTAPPAPAKPGQPQARDGSGAFGVNISGSAAVNTVDNRVSARVTDDLDLTVGAVNVQASDDTALHAIAGGAAVSRNTGDGVGLAGAYTQNSVDSRIEAELAATGHVTSRSVDVQADNESSALSISAGVSASASATSYQVAGSVSVNNIDATTRARLADGDVTATDGAKVAARDDSTLHAVAGAVTYGGKAGVGAGLSINHIEGATEAEVDNLRGLHSNGGLDVSASDTSDLVSVAAAMGYSNKYAFDGAVSINELDHDTRAAVSGSQGLVLGGGLTVDAHNASTIWNASGSAAIGRGGAIGASFGYNTISDRVTAELLNSNVQAASAQLKARQDGDINALVAGGAVAAQSGPAVAGSVAINTIDNQTRASSQDSTLVSRGGLSIDAQDASRIRSLTGALAYGGQGAGIGLAGSYNKILGGVYAGAHGGVLQAGELLRVSALRNQQLQTLAAGAGASGSTGVAGSVAVNMAGGSTLAELAGGVKASTDGSLLLSARSDSDIETVAGALGVGMGGVGLAGAVAVNQLDGTTTARVSGSGTQLTAKGQGTAVQVDSGQLDGDTSRDLRDRTRQESLNGVGVIASSTDEINTVAASVGGGSNVGVSGAVTVNHAGGATLAAIDDASVTSQAATQVGAYHHTRVTTGNGAGAGGGSAGVGASVTTNTLDHDTQARVSAANLTAQGDIGVNARATHDLDAVVVGAALGGSAGVNGSVAVTTLDGAVRSRVDGSSLHSQGGGIEIAADADNDLNIVAGGVAGGGVAGVGATVVVTDLDQRTEAGTSGNTRLDAAGLTQVDAQAAQDIDVVAFTGAGGGTAGVAGTVNVLTSTGQTLAGIGAGSQVNTRQDGAQQDVRVHARDSLDTTSVLGTVGAGGVAGVGAGADVQVVRSGAVASVGDGAVVNADRDISISAENDRDIDSASIAAAGGGYVGAGAGVSVVSVASGASSNATGSLDNSLGNAQQVGRNSGLNGQMGNQFAGASQLQADINARQQSVSPNSTFLASPDSTQYSAAARVGNATLDAGRNIAVSARNTTDAASEAAGVAAGAVGAGAGVAVINVGDRSLAELGGVAKAGGNLSIQAEDAQGGTTEAKAQAGGGGVVGLGAAVAVSEKTSSTTAQVLDGAKITTGGALQVGARLDHALKSETVGVAVGGVAVGASVATTSSAGQAQALLGRNVQVTAGSVAVDATARSTNNAQAVGASGGILAGNAVVATASDTTKARAWAGDGSLLLARNGVGIRASTDPMTRALAFGASIGSGAIGASVATAKVNNGVEAGTGAVNIGAASLEVTASAQRTRDQSAEAKATGATGGVLMGINATVAASDLDTDVLAQVGEGSQLAITGNAAVKASDATRVKTDSTGIAVGGALAMGANVGKADIDAAQRVRFGASGRVDGTLDLSATGTNGITGDAVAGSGGVIAGSASTLDLEASSTTAVEVLGSTALQSGKANVKAEHQLDYDADSDSLQAAAVGASGTFIDLSLGADTQVQFRDGARLAGREGLDVEAHTITQGGADAYSGSGGVLTGSAVLVDNAIRDSSRIQLGNNVNLATNGSPLDVEKGHLRMNAHNTMRVADVGRLKAGGAIAAPYAGTELKVTVNNQVLVGDNANLRSSGLLQVGSYSDTRASTDARVDVFGLVGAGGGDSKIDLTASQLVRFGANADLLGYGNIGLRAGQSGDGNLSNDIRAKANTLVVNNTLVPVTAVLDVDAVASTTNDLILGNNNQVRSVRNVDLVATNGKVSADGSGTGKNPYLSLFSSEQTVRSNKVNQLASLNLANAKVVAGVANRQELYWDGQTARVVSSLGDLTYSVSKAGSANAFRPLAQIDATLAQLNQQLAGLTPGSSEHARLSEQIALYTQMRASTAKSLGAGADGTTSVDSLIVNDLIAGAGDIRVGADRIQQSGADLTAYGAPTVVIHNSSDDYLVTNGILVSAAGTGTITSTGAAKLGNSGARLTEVGHSQSDFYDANQRPSVPSIVIRNTYDTQQAGNTSPAPAILVLGDIQNLKGNTALSNVSGNVSQFATIESYQLSMNVPNGDLFVNLPGRTWNLASVQAEWATIIRNLSPEVRGLLNGRSVTDAIAEYAANAVYNTNADGSLKYTDAEAFTDFLIRRYGRGDGRDQQVIVGGIVRDYWENDDTDTSDRVDFKDGKYVYTGNQDADDLSCVLGLNCVTGVWNWTYVGLNTLGTRNNVALNQADTSGSAQSALRVGGALAINAKNININAGIEVGSRTDWSLNLNGAVANEIGSIAAGNGLVRLNSVSALDGSDEVPLVYWDSDSRRIQVQRIDAAGGGSVSLTGNIINTNVLGNIRVNSGYGDVQINNTTGYDLLLSDIDLGNGGQSVVRVTDTLKSWGDGRAQTWWYVNQAGQTSVSVYNDSNGASGLTGALLDSTIGREFTYKPQTGARYEWTHEYHVTRNYSGGTSVSGDTTDMDEKLGSWVSAISNADGSSYRVGDGKVVVRDATGDDKAFMQWANGEIGFTRVTVTDDGNNDWGGFDNGTVFNVANDIKLTLTNSVKADYAIPIRFVGNTESRLKVDSTSNVMVGGDIRNNVGTSRFDVTGGSLQQAGGSLQGKDLILNASQGIGSASQGLNIIDSRVAGASISALSQGDVFLNSTGDVYAKSIQTTGDVTVNAVGGIYQHADTTGVAIAGDVLNLHSGSGSSIGGMNRPLVTQSNEINASAPGSVTLTQASGHMKVGFIESLFGNVELNTPSGQIIGAAPKGETQDAKRQAQIKEWEAMGLTDADNAKSTINGYENLVERYYGEYWSIRGLASNPDGSFSLSQQGLTQYREQVAASLGRAPTDAEINTAIKARYQEAKSFLAGAPGLDQGLLQTRDSGFQYSLDTQSALYAQMTHGAVWDKSMLGTVINAGAVAGERPSTGALPNVAATQGSIRLNNDPTQPLPASETLVFTLKRTGDYLPLVTQLSSSEGNQYSSSQLLAFLAEAKPGTLQAEQVDGDTVRVTLRPRYDLVVEAKDPVVIDAKGDYHVGTSQDVILKDITVGGTLYVYAGRDVINQTAKGVAGAVTGGLYIDAGRNIGSPDNPIQVTNNGNDPVTVYRLVAPGTANVVVLNGNVVVGKIDVKGETNLVANNGNFSSLGDHATFTGGLVNLRAVDGNGKTSGYIGTAVDPFKVVQQQGALGLFGLGANILATQNDLVMSNSVLDGRVGLTAATGSIRMDDEDSVIRTTDEADGQVDLVAATGVGDATTAVRLHTSRFNAETPVGDVNLHLLREAHAQRVHALTGSARVIGEGDGVLGTTDLDLDDVRVARNLELRAESIRGRVTQTLQSTPLSLWATHLGGGVADRVDLAVSAAPYVRAEQLAARVADVRSDATRFNVLNGYIGEQMNLTTGYVTALMDNTTPALRYDHDFQYYIPWKGFSLDLETRGATGSRAPMWFDVARGVFTRNQVTSGFAAFDVARPHFSADFRSTVDGRAMPAFSAAYPVRPVLQPAQELSTAPLAVNLGSQSDDDSI